MDTIVMPLIIWVFVLNNIAWMIILYVCVKTVSIPPEQRKEVIAIENKIQTPPKKPFVEGKMNTIENLTDISLKQVAKSL